MGALKDFIFTQAEKLGLDVDNLTLNEISTVLSNHAQEVCTNGALDNEEVVFYKEFLPKISKEEVRGNIGEIYTDQSGTKFLIVA